MTTVSPGSSLELPAFEPEPELSLAAGSGSLLVQPTSRAPAASSAPDVVRSRRSGLLVRRDIGSPR